MGQLQVAIVTRGRVGRPRKANVRRTSGGKSKGEVVDLAVVLNQPHRRGQSDPKDLRHGTALGRLHVRGMISDDQLRAGDEWGRIVLAYRRVLCAPPLSPRTGQMAERVSSGFGVDNEPREQDPEEALKRLAVLRDKYNRAFEMLGLLDRTLGRGGGISQSISRAVRKVCVDDRDLNEVEVGDARVGLNSLARVLFEDRGGR